ncbi:MAG: prolipoprotein diacylglyceryl transferase [Actinobacteria bacterium]|nr:prolipoprotein diacylglyceryl transferase [Actinomycetota bacterium]
MCVKKKCPDGNYATNFGKLIGSDKNLYGCLYLPDTTSFSDGKTSSMCKSGKTLSSLYPMTGNEMPEMCVSSPQIYFGANGNPLDALRIWKGGLGIWGAISLGAFGAFIYFRKNKTTLNFSTFLDALAPGVLLAQAIGRIGNWFNQELFGKPTNLVWGLEIKPSKRPVGYEQFLTFHPTFLYELLWCLFIAILLIKLPGYLRKIPSKSGDIFVMYIFGYSMGRLWIESLRIDEANLILGLRLNIWVSITAIISSTIYLILTRARKKPTNHNVSS